MVGMSSIIRTTDFYTACGGSGKRFSCETITVRCWVSPDLEKWHAYPCWKILMLTSIGVTSDYHNCCISTRHTRLHRHIIGTDKLTARDGRSITHGWFTCWKCAQSYFSEGLIIPITQETRKIADLLRILKWVWSMVVWKNRARKGRVEKTYLEGAWLCKVIQW